MAQRNIKKIRLQLQFNNGMDGEKQLLLKRTYGNIPVNVTDDKLYSVGAVLADMSDKTLFAIARNEEAHLV